MIDNEELIKKGYKIALVPSITNGTWGETNLFFTSIGMMETDEERSKELI